MKSFDRSILARALMTGAASLAFVMIGAAVVRAGTVTGADGTAGAFCYGDPSIDESCAVNGGDGESVSAGGNPAVAIGGNGGAAGDTGYGYGDGDGTGNGGNGGSATAVATGGSIASASATGGAGGYSGLSYGGSGGNAFATSKAFGGSGGASSSAYATGGAALSPGGTGGGATATANALATRGGLAIALAAATGGEHWIYGGNYGADATSTAKSTFAVANVRSTDEAEEAANGYQGTTYTVTTNAVAQAGGSGQSFVTPDNGAYAFSTVLPDKADVATLIGGASTVASAFLGPRDIVFGTAILGFNDSPDEQFDSFTFSDSSTFDFSYRGDLLLGVIEGDFSVIINGVQVLAEEFVDDGVINLGSSFGPNIDLTIVSYGGDFVLGGAVPEPSTWAMMLVGFAGIGFMGWRRRAAWAG
jgi:hypothetical protein